MWSSVHFKRSASLRRGRCDHWSDSSDRNLAVIMILLMGSIDRNLAVIMILLSATFSQLTIPWALLTFGGLAVGVHLRKRDRNKSRTSRRGSSCEESGCSCVASELHQNDARCQRFAHL